MKTDNLIKLLKYTKVDKANTFCAISKVPGGVLARSTSDDGMLVTFVTLNEEFPIELEFGINDMDKLSKILGLHDEEVTIKLVRPKLIITNSNSKLKSEYAYSVTDYKKQTKVKAQDINNTGEIYLTPESMVQMIKAMKVLSDGDAVGIVMADDESIVSVGSIKDHSNKITFNISSNIYEKDSIYEIFYLNLQLVKQVLETNQNCTDSKLFVDDGGIVTFKFNYENISVIYYLLMLEVNDD